MSEPATSHVDSPALLVRGSAGLALLGTVIAIVDHIGLSLPSADGWLAIPGSAWGWAAVHLLGGLVSLHLGYRLLTRAYPLRDLATQGATNPAAAVQLTAHRLAAAAIAGACWGGCDAPSVGVAMGFTLAAWLALILICAAHRVVTRYHDHEEIAAGNLASALASAGLHLAVALVTVHALQGPFQGWRTSLLAFTVALAWVLALYPLRQVVVARLILGLTPREMDLAVAGRQAVWIGAVEGLGYLLTAMALASAW